MTNLSIPPIELCLPESWIDSLSADVQSDYMLKLRRFLKAEELSGWQVCPSRVDILAALRETPLPSVKVVILGEEPYCRGAAHGLSFSVMGEEIPKSLENILSRVGATMRCDAVPGGSSNGVIQQNCGCLTGWANQGVLLLNSVLTVARDLPNSHRGRGWEKFTDKIIEVVARSRRGVVFMLWGNRAQKKARIVRQAGQCQEHLILCASHPSSRSVSQTDRPFADCEHFKDTNVRLGSNNAIDWFRVTRD